MPAGTQPDTGSRLLRADAFVPSPRQTRDHWAADRHGRITRPQSITVTLEALDVRVIGPDRAEAGFLQRYQSDTFSDVVDKRLELVWERDDWYVLAKKYENP